MTSITLEATYTVQNAQSQAIASGEGDAPSRSSGKGGRSWLVAIAEAMGSALGQKAARLVELSNKLDKLTAEKESGNLSEKEEEANAMEFQKTMSEFQAESQMFSMLSNAFSTAVKSIGEGMTALARKQ